VSEYQKAGVMNSLDSATETGNHNAFSLEEDF